MMGCIYKISKNNNDETEEIKTRFLTTSKAYSSLQTISRSQKMYQNNKIRLYTTLIKPVLCYGSVTWTITHMTEQMLRTYERKILRRIYGPIQDKGHWHRRCNGGTYHLYKDINNMYDI